MHWIFKAAAIGAATGYGALYAKRQLEAKGYGAETQAALMGAATLVIFIASTAIVGTATDAAAQVAGV